MEGEHEKVLQKLIETNMEHLSGYGTDEHCESDKKKIKTLVFIFFCSLLALSLLKIKRIWIVLLSACS